MVEGTFAHPSMADTIPMRATEAARGHVTFTVRADKRHLNPLGGVHGGFAATVLDSVTGCAVHTMLDVGVGYGTVDLNVKMLKAIPLDRELYRGGPRHPPVEDHRRLRGIPETKRTLLAHATATCAIIRS